MWTCDKYFLKKVRVLDQTKFSQGQDQTITFFCNFEKVTTTGSSHFLSPNGQGFS